MSIIITGIESLVGRLIQMKKRAEGDSNRTVVVQFTAPYAIYVHENLEARHPNGGQAKFLEQPTREMGRRLGWVIAREILKGNSVIDAEMIAGNQLLNVAKSLCPVDTGFLRDSGVVEIQENI